ncbi:exonuclease domain-containing protein [Salegentibacter maritimus]|uniref:exonuclease domain-containing protein n=1 Tax=Salegentibacter maritimus TaxID=2794347 RepID=UPI0018E4A110|nr:exonuclease domain-containing protein [Salegentibacter maritimus]MBI6116417.1 ribonuclease H-like domain-containing protein [Salegentibacter maritimus]
MFNWFNKKESREPSIEITIKGVNPNTENEFLFFDFVDKTNSWELEHWFNKVKSDRIKFKPRYEYAINQKLKTGKFKNPHSFPEYFDNQFDYIAIDFETANKNRVSACAIGLVFIKNYKVAYEVGFKIKPPKNEKFSSFHTNLHGISKEDVSYWGHFDELWKSELSKYLNDSLIVFHNSSMDLSILKNLFYYYSISDFHIDYIDTMQLAEKCGLSKKLEDLASKFDVEIENPHDPVADAKTCAIIFNELIDIYPNHKELIGKLSVEIENEHKKKVQATNQVKNDNIGIIQEFSISKEELNNLKIENKGFLFSGELTQERSDCKNFIKENGGLIKSSVTSKLDYIVIGTDYGWAKIQKVQELNLKKKCNIKILSNSDFNIIQEKNAT